MNINGIQVRKDLTGQVWGHLTAIKPVGRNNHHQTIWEFYCDLCGQTCEKVAYYVTSGDTLTCGCGTNNLHKEARTLDITNCRYGKLTAIYNTKRQDKYGNYYWHCICDCTGECDVTAASLVSGNTTSCGCVKSRGEYEITQLLAKNIIAYEKEYGFNTLVSENNIKLRYDFYLPKYNRLIEFDGEQHYQSQMHGWNDKEHFEKRKEYDDIKNKYAKDNGIDLVRIPYWERGNITLDMLLGKEYLI